MVPAVLGLVGRFRMTGGEGDLVGVVVREERQPGGDDHDDHEAGDPATEQDVERDPDRHDEPDEPEQDHKGSALVARDLLVHGD